MKNDINVFSEFFSRQAFAECIMQEEEWRVKRCKDCGGEMDLILNNKFEEVKQCKECGRKTMLIKKIKELSE